MYKFLCFVLMVNCGGTVWASPNSTADIKGTIAFSYFTTGSLYDLHYSVHGSLDAENMDIKGNGFAIEPGVRWGFKKNDDNTEKGFLFLELPVSMFNGSENMYTDLSPVPINISGSVVEMGIGLRFGASYRAYNKMSILAGLHLERVFQSFEMEENAVHFSSIDPIKNTAFVSGSKIIPMFGVSFSASENFELAVILNFPNSSDLKTDSSTTMIVADEIIGTYTRLRTSDAASIEIKTTISW